VYSHEYRVRICRLFKWTRNRFLAWRAGMTKTTLFVEPARQATKAGIIDSSESIPGLQKRLQIRALDTYSCTVIKR
jgi:hypothetical protein